MSSAAFIAYKHCNDHNNKTQKQPNLFPIHFSGQQRKGHSNSFLGHLSKILFAVQVIETITMVLVEAITALKPVTLQGDPHYDKSEIAWTTTDGVKTAIKTQELILVAEIPGGTYLIATLTEAQPSGDDDRQEPPFTVSSFLASSLPSELLQEQPKLLLRDLPEYLRTGLDASLDVIVSLRSGTGLSPTFYEAVLQPLLGVLGLKADDGGETTKDNSYNVTFTKDADTVKNFARQRWGQGSEAKKDKKKKETVILVSGDGGIVDLLSAASPPPSSEEDKDTTISSILLPTVVILPLGTGNALFHSLHKPHYDKSITATPSHLVLALRALFQGRPAPLPTFQASFSPAAHPVSGAEVSTETQITAMTGAIVASYGFHAQLVWESDTPAYRVHGAKRFGMVAQELLGESHAYHAVVETGRTDKEKEENNSGSTTKWSIVGKEKDRDKSYFNYVLTTLCSNLEKTFTISPASEPLDGILRLVHFGGADGKRTMEIMTAAYNEGTHAGMDDVGYKALEVVKVTTLEDDARWRKVCIDGTILELPREGSMTVKRSPHNTLQVVVLHI